MFECLKFCFVTIYGRHAACYTLVQALGIDKPSISVNDFYWMSELTMSGAHMHTKGLGTADAQNSFKCMLMCMIIHDSDGSNATL
jgi:hypothetical protein